MGVRKPAQERNTVAIVFISEEKLGAISMKPTGVPDCRAPKKKSVKQRRITPIAGRGQRLRQRRDGLTWIRDMTNEDETHARAQEPNAIGPLPYLPAGQMTLHLRQDERRRRGPRRERDRETGRERERGAQTMHQLKAKLNSSTEMRLQR
jgi:hypothetical protein